MIDAEDIDFQIGFISEYGDYPPGAKIYIDDVCKFKGLIHEDKEIKFNHRLNFDAQHCLRIERYNKECSKPVNGIHQTLVLDKVKIDGIDIQNIIYSRSYNIPDYPEHWIKQNPGLEKIILAETHFGFNGSWRLNFNSPFYQFMIDAVSGRLSNVPIY